ncbi:MAG: hypothetical protein ACO3YN_02930 [Rubrivivax sp.]
MKGGRLVWAASALALLSGCATIDPFAVQPMAAHLQRGDRVGECARQWQARDAAVRAAGTRDAQETVIPGFPYLRLDRLGQAILPAPVDGADTAAQVSAGTSAVIATAVGDAAPAAAARAVDAPLATSRAWQAWRERLSALDHQARAVEARNAGIDVTGDTDACRQVLMQADASPAAQQALRAAARVPDDYASAWRALGLYPLTRLGFAVGIRAWQDRTREVFAQPLAALPVEGGLQRLWPAPDAAAGLRSVAGLPADAADPSLAPAPLRALLQQHAPVLEIDTTGDHDRVGPLAFADGRVVVDRDAAPVAYVRQSQALLAGRLHRQLVYTFWFPRRPKAHALDLLGGELDALVWRVTLDDDGHALLYDSIHACGCYHLFFTTERMRPRPGRPAGQGWLDEGLFMPQPGALPAAVPGVAASGPDPASAPTSARIVLRVQARTHYLQRVQLAGPLASAGLSSTAAAARPPLAYRLVDEDSLRSLPWRPATSAAPAPSPRASHRSVYDPQGLIPGSERLERFLFWPMGIASAGQMRQWGRQATAFVGRRHFDDPLLLDRYFERAMSGPGPTGGGATGAPF